MPEAAVSVAVIEIVSVAAPIDSVSTSDKPAFTPLANGAVVSFTVAVAALKLVPAVAVTCEKSIPSAVGIEASAALISAVDTAV